MGYGYVLNPIPFKDDSSGLTLFPNGQVLAVSWRHRKACGGGTFFVDPMLPKCLWYVFIIYKLVHEYSQYLPSKRLWDKKIDTEVMGTSTIQYFSMPRMQWFLHESKFKTPQIWYILSLGVTQGWFIDPLWCFQTSWGVKYFLLIHGMCFLLICYSRFLLVIPRCNYMVGQDGVQRHSVDLFYGVPPWCLHRNTSFAEKVLSTSQKADLKPLHIVFVVVIIQTKRWVWVEG